MTFLPNRRRFIADLQQMSLEYDISPHMLVVVTLADATHYHAVLRALGHGFAEDLLRAGAGLLQALLPPVCVLYQVSVLSFAFIQSVDDPGRTPAIAVDLAHIFARPIQCQGIPIAARVGIGLYPLESRGVSPADALRGALAAAHDSRNRARGIAHFDPATDTAQQRAFALLTDLREALGRETAGGDGQLSLHYQPRIDFVTGRVNSAEMLLRWTHPRLGLIGPDEFIPLVETTGLIVPLTDWILLNGLRHLRQWRNAGQPLKASVNIAPSSLRDPQFVERLVGLMDGFAVPAAQLELEFTEGMLASKDPAVLRQIEEIRAHGMDIAIDDFGIGYSNIDYLTRIPAQRLKIDKSFIRPLDRSQRHRVLVRNLIALAHGLGYTVVAEGIETQDCYDLLKSWDCDQGQGFLMGRPMPEPAFRHWLASQNGLAV